MLTHDSSPKGRAKNEGFMTVGVGSKPPPYIILSFSRNS